VTLVLTVDPAGNVRGDSDALDVKLGVVGGIGVGVGTTIADVTANAALTLTVVAAVADVPACATVKRCWPTVALEGTTTVALNAPRRFVWAVGMPVVAPSQLKTIDA